MKGRSSVVVLGVALVACFGGRGPLGAAQPAVPGYADFAALRTQLTRLAASPHASLRSLGVTRGKRDVYLLTVGAGEVDGKPAVLVIGSVDPRQLLGSELAVRMARRLVEGAEDDDAVRELLGRVTFYFIPRPSPDAAEAFFRRPYVERIRNQRPVDDDHDGRVDEDGPDDLSGDGWITAMRVRDPAGKFIAHPDDPRVMIEADAERGERGCWRLLVEGCDNDGDEEFNEDPPGGVALNRNFTFEYSYFGETAGPHQVSEPESRAVADFAFAHPSIAVLLSFSPQGNLMNPWEPGKGDGPERGKTALFEADAPYYAHLAERYQEIHGGENPPESTPIDGSLGRWAYFHYGRWSLIARGWWIPKVAPDSEPEKKSKGAAEDQDAAEEDDDAPEEKKQEKDDRGEQQRRALRWFAREGIDGFVPWKRIEHPDFLGKRVEVGGIKPFVMLNPPVEELDGLVDTHFTFLAEAADKLPRLRFEEIETDSLGGGTWRVEVTLVNRGFLPTVSEMGGLCKQLHPVQIELQLPEGAALVSGHPRVQVPPLAGGGGTVKRSWLVRTDQTGSTKLKVRAWSPSVGEAVKAIRLIENDNDKQ